MVVYSYYFITGASNIMSRIGKQQDMMQYEDMPDPLPFAGLEKSTVLQETKIFAESTVNERKCIQAVVKLLYLLSQGEELTESEATDIFFATTKLFQSEDQDLRRQVYILMKELSPYADQMFIATQILYKDIDKGTDMQKANAIRTLRKITDVTMLGPGERSLKQAILDKNPPVGSAALVTGLHLTKTVPDLVRKWSNEVSEALRQKSHMVQYHSLALLHKLKKNNRQVVLKQVQSAQTIPINSPLALCLLIRMCTEFLQDDIANNEEMYRFVKESIRHGVDMVVFEAAKCLCSLRLNAKELTSVVVVLQIYLSFYKPVLKFATLRLLNKLATTNPLLVATCNIDMETLFTDSNRNIATLAITTVLMTGSEHSIDRLMKEITRFLNDIADEFKSVVIQSMRVLGKKFPQKHAVFLKFLNDALRSEGGFEYKMSIVETIANIVETNPAAKEEELLSLCTLIEDCEYSKISQRILSLLGKEGPKNPTPSKFVRFIYNRVLLEVPVVRAAAVSTLAKFAAKCENLRDSIMTLLHRAASDNDGEVRDRALFYIALLEEGDQEMIDMFIMEVETDVRVAVPAPIAAGDAPPPIDNKSSGLSALVAIPEDVENKWVCYFYEIILLKKKTTNTKKKKKKKKKQALELERVPEFRKLGEVFKTTEPQYLTDKECEYVVTYVTHCYTDYMILHFKIKNTLEDQAFYNLQINVDIENDEDLVSYWKPKFAINAKIVEPNGEGSCFVCFDREAAYPEGTATATLRFASEEDADDEDEYPLAEDIFIALNSYLRGNYIPDFKAAWETETDEVTEETYLLDIVKNLQTVTNLIINIYGFSVMDGTGEVPTDSSTVEHEIHLSGQMCFEPHFDLLMLVKVCVIILFSIIYN